LSDNEIDLIGGKEENMNITTYKPNNCLSENNRHVHLGNGLSGVTLNVFSATCC